MILKQLKTCVTYHIILKRLKTCVTHCVTDQFVISLFCVCVLELGRSRFIKVPKHEDFDSCPRNFGTLKLSS